MSELYRILIIALILLGINFVVLKMLPSLNVKLNGAEMYVLYLDLLFILYLILPHNVGIYV
tara:strand:- start:214 stop:396 length:183 start_codon:yes stop_codon:yes gene_type:complete